MRLLACLAFPFVLIVSFVLLSAAPATAADKQPNIIIFLADDVGWGEFGCQGNKEIPTPHIDSIAKNGVRFTQGYVAATYCSPCRAGLMTGRYPTRFGHEFNEGGADGQRPLRPARYRNDDRRPPQGPRLRHLCRRQVAPRRRSGIPADQPRLRRVLRHGRQHAVLQPAELRRLPRRPACHSR